MRAAALPAAACVWIAVLMAAPLALSRGSFPLGTVATYQSASVLCHQKTERSFKIAGTQMPVCARCFGLYLAGAPGALAVFAFRRRRAPHAAVVRAALALASVPMLLSLGLEWFDLIQGSNVTRFASALPLGLTAGWVLQRTVIGPHHSVPGYV